MHAQTRSMPPCNWIIFKTLKYFQCNHIGRSSSILCLEALLWIEFKMVTCSCHLQCINYVARGYTFDMCHSLSWVLCWRWWMGFIDLWVLKNLTYQPWLSLDLCLLGYWKVTSLSTSYWWCHSFKLLHFHLGKYLSWDALALGAHDFYFPGWGVLS